MRKGMIAGLLIVVFRATAAPRSKRGLRNGSDANPQSRATHYAVPPPGGATRQ